MREAAKKHAQYDGRLGDLLLVSGKLTYMQKGKLPTSRHVAGAVAEFEAGGDAGSRVTATRVGAGLIIAGPIGAIVGGVLRKNMNRVYVTVTLPDGEVMIADAPVKDERKAREFAQRVTAAGVAYAD